MGQFNAAGVPKTVFKRVGINNIKK